MAGQPEFGIPNVNALFRDLDAMDVSVAEKVKLARNAWNEGNGGITGQVDEVFWRKLKALEESA